LFDIILRLKEIRPQMPNTWSSGEDRQARDGAAFILSFEGVQSRSVV